MPGSITWVLKSSKKCNLRCRYCYELEHLSESTRIRVEHFDKMFLRIGEISEHFDAVPKFCWHGGEPLLLPSVYYEAAFSSQKRIFRNLRQKPQNVIQTNLTILGPNELKLLKNFTQISISLDLFGGLRVAQNGRDVQSVILKNLAVLSNSGLSVGAISVLTQNNINKVENIFDFFNRTGISFRLLPFYRSANSQQVDEYSISYKELRDAYLLVLDKWFTHGNGISVKPIDDCVKAAISDLWGGDQSKMKYDKAQREFVFVVDTNLDVFSVAETYNPDYCFGNLLKNTSKEILDSAGRSRAVRESLNRITSVCSKCGLYGACSGWPIGEATVLERYFDDDGNMNCAVIRPLIQRAKEWLLSDPALARDARRTYQVS